MKKPVKYTCVVDTTYTLSLYLLLQSEQAIKDTVFFVGNAIPENISQMLPNVIRIKNDTDSYNTRLKILKHRVEALFKWRFRHRTTMYAQDHLVFSSHIIGSNNYILLEDAPRIYTNYKTISFMMPIFPCTLKLKFYSWLYWGRIGRRRLGTNKQCVNRIVSTKEDAGSDILIGKNCTYVNLQELWRESSEKKKNYIKEMFGVSNEIMGLPKRFSVILFSQPLMEDCKLTEQEMKEIYSPYINKYSSQGVVIKPHPRDKFDYKSNYPNVGILNCKAPMQLLNAIGVEFKTAITVCSSAVTSMPEDSEIIWIGPHVNIKIYNVYGDLKCPR